MNALQLIRENWSAHNYREAMPVESSDLALLVTLTPRATKADRVLLDECVSYDQGQPLFIALQRVDGIIFAKLETVEEFNAA